jgi:EAL domain-containing protein (putative c-di-GMP-specific phosphodiesterase class I)
LVADLQASARDRLILKSTIDLAHGLGMKVVAEGVKDAATASLLAGLGCDQIQGYLIGRPMPADQLAAFLRDERAEPAPPGNTSQRLQVAL